MAARRKIAFIFWWIILPAAAGVALCLIATAYASPGYFAFMKWAVAALGGWMIYITAGRRLAWLPIGFGVMLLVFNPILPVQARPDVWHLLERLAAAWFGVGGVFAAGVALRRG